MCFQTLSIVQSGVDFSFLCEFCQWNSKSIELLGVKPQALLAALKAKEDAIVAASNFPAINAKYREMFKESKKDSGPPTFSTPFLRPKKQEHDLHESILELEKAAQAKVAAHYKLPSGYVANESAKPPPESLLTEKFDICEQPSMEQRLANPTPSPTLSGTVLLGVMIFPTKK